jgi:hypothetical protein
MRKLIKNIVLAPNRLVKYPKGIRNKDPKITGIAVVKAI